MEKEKWGVHITHCCVKHGCKYGDKDCPVVLKQVKQKYLCDCCAYDEINNVDDLYDKTYFVTLDVVGRDEDTVTVVGNGVEKIDNYTILISGSVKVTFEYPIKHIERELEEEEQIPNED